MAAGVTDLTQLRLDHPSPGFTGADLFLQRVAADDQDAAITGAELREGLLFGITSPGSAGQVAVSTGTAWSYVSSSGSGLILRSSNPSVNGMTVTGQFTHTNGQALLGHYGSSFVLAANSSGGVQKLGLFSTAPVAQPTINFTAWANAGTQNVTFQNQITQVLSALLSLGIVRVA